MLVEALKSVLVYARNGWHASPEGFFATTERWTR
jgi:hypothetical protein